MRLPRYVRCLSWVPCLWLLVSVSPAWSLAIVPTFTDSAGETWTAERQAVVNHAIGDWETVIGDAQTVNVEFDFTNAGTGGYLAQWSHPGFSVPLGTDIYPWTPQVVHTIHFNVDLFYEPNYTWFDPTPSTDGDQPFLAWDALTITLHELGHALGFTAGTYFDNVGTGTQFDKWGSQIVGTTFDPGGLDVEMAADLAHLADPSPATFWDLMTPALVNSVRHDISPLDLDMLSLAYGYSIVLAPEPSTALLVGVGLLGVAMMRRRERC